MLPLFVRFWRDRSALLTVPGTQLEIRHEYVVCGVARDGGGAWCGSLWWGLLAKASGHRPRGEMRGCEGTPALYAATSMESNSQDSTSENESAGVGDGGSVLDSLQRRDGSGDRLSAVGQLVERFPPPGAGYIPKSEVVAIGRAYDMKIVKAASGLWEARAAIRTATDIIRTIRKKRALVQFWTVDDAGEGRSELDDLLGEWGVCCDRITKAVLTTKRTVLSPASM